MGTIPPDAVVLDLGSNKGSYAAGRYGFTTIRVDVQRAQGMDDGALFVQADAARLPFKEQVFTVVICNNSLEHFAELEKVLAEIRRVAAPRVALYVAVPDSTTITDILYRWLGRGGGHVNQFQTEQVAESIERITAMPLRAKRVLLTSLSFLNRKNQTSRPPRKLWLVGGGTEFSLHIINWLLRLCDRALGTRLAVYGWAFYFGNVPQPIERGPWRNVCIRCGSGHPAARLNDVRRIVRWYSCPQCGTKNIYYG